jgi:hypothetical protein
MRVLAVCVVVALMGPAPEAGAEESWALQRAPVIKLAPVAEFDGQWLKWIMVAEPEWSRAGLDASRYKVGLLDSKDSVTVLLTNRLLSQPRAVQDRDLPEFGVSISKSTGKVLSASFLK